MDHFCCLVALFRGVEVGVEFTARLALICGNRLVSEAILSGPAHRAGTTAGWACYTASPITPPPCAPFLADHGDAEKILTAARRVPAAARAADRGWPPGQPATRSARDVLADALTIFGADDRLHLGQRLRSVRRPVESTSRSQG